jgi:hypothetical protein
MLTDDCVQLRTDKWLYGTLNATKLIESGINCVFFSCKNLRKNQAIPFPYPSKTIVKCLYMRQLEAVIIPEWECICTYKVFMKAQSGSRVFTTTNGLNLELRIEKDIVCPKIHNERGGKNCRLTFRIFDVSLNIIVKTQSPTRRS